MKEINLIVIADRHCQTTFTYLEYLRYNNYLPNKILLVDFLSNNKKVKLVQKFIGRYLASKLVSFYKHLRTRATSFKETCQILQTGKKVRVNFFSSMNYGAYAKKIDKLIVNDYRELKEYLIQNKENAFLYAGGGLVPKEITELNGVKIIHIHPGVVPDVKGSDGFFWSLLIKGKVGISCFYMNSGIDTGDIIKTAEYDISKIQVPKETNPNFLYKAILFSYEPHLRADILIKVLDENQGNDLRNLSTKKQSPIDGRTFFAMHPKLLNYVIFKQVCDKV